MIIKTFMILKIFCTLLRVLDSSYTIPYYGEPTMVRFVAAVPLLSDMLPLVDLVVLVEAVRSL